jgi:hypothetical protein
MCCVIDVPRLPRSCLCQSSEDANSSLKRADEERAKASKAPHEHGTRRFSALHAPHTATHTATSGEMEAKRTLIKESKVFVGYVRVHIIVALSKWSMSLGPARPFEMLYCRFWRALDGRISSSGPSQPFVALARISPDKHKVDRQSRRVSITSPRQSKCLVNQRASLPLCVCPRASGSCFTITFQLRSPRVAS